MRKKSPKLPQSQNRSARCLGRGLRWGLHSKRPTMSRRTVQSLHFAPDIRQVLSFNGRYSHSTAPWKMGYTELYTPHNPPHTKKGSKKWIKKWHEVAHKKVWCKNGISNEAKARPHEKRASFRALNSRLYGIHGPSKSPNRYLVDLGTLSLVGRSHINMQQVGFWSWHHESWALCDCLTNAGRQNTKHNTENPAKHLGISRCRYLYSTSWLARNLKVGFCFSLLCLITLKSDLWVAACEFRDRFLYTSRAQWPWHSQAHTAQPLCYLLSFLHVLMLLHMWSQGNGSNSSFFGSMDGCLTDRIAYPETMVERNDGWCVTTFLDFAEKGLHQHTLKPHSSSKPRL